MTKIEQLYAIMKPFISPITIDEFYSDITSCEYIHPLVVEDSSNVCICDCNECWKQEVNYNDNKA